jgi:hypothetical protein
VRSLIPVARSRADGLVLAPLLIVAALAAHAGAYVIAVPDARARAAALGRTGHAYLAWAPDVAGLAGLLLVVALALRAVAASHGARSGRIHPSVALVPAAGFLVQEALERLLLGGVSPSYLAERPVLIGIALQLLLGALAVAAGRLLVRSMERIGRRLRDRRRIRWPAPRGARPAVRPSFLRPQPLALKLAGRAPPSHSF